MYTVNAGRVICKNGIELFSIKQQMNTATGKAEFYPTQCDAMAHFIAEVLNSHDKTWQNFYKIYMRK